MKSSDQADSGGDWRVQLQDMRTISAMRAGSPHPDEVERLSDRALRAAALNPDHSDEARAAAAEALRARRLSPEPWRVRVPSFLSARDLERGDQVFFGFWPAVWTWLGRAFRVGVIVAVGWALVSGQYPDMSPQFDLAVFVPSFLLLLLFGVMVAWALRSVLRPKPARVAFVRAAALSDRAAREFVAGELRPYGHVASVAGSANGATVKSAADYRARALEMGNRLGLNLINMSTRRETMALSATDQWRPLVLNFLMDSSDAIVVDLSDGGSWALAAIQAEGAASRCVFVALWGRLEEAEAALRAAGLSQRVFPYAPDGEMQRRPLFRAAMLKAMRATHAASA